MSAQAKEYRPDIYEEAAREQLTVAGELHGSGRYLMSHYTAGVAVECMLRAYKSRLDPVLDERHDLQRLATNGRFWDGASDERLPILTAALGEVMTRWENGHRYRSEAALRRFLTDRKLFFKKGDLLQNSSRKIVDAAAQLISFGAAKWKKSKG